MRLGMKRKLFTYHDLFDLFEYHNVDLDASIGSCMKHPIEPVLLIFRWRPSQVDFGRKPP